MPRYSGHYPGAIAHLKKNITDIIFDFVEVYKFLADYYEEYLNPVHIKEFRNTAKNLSKLKPAKPAYKNRIYITTNYKFVSFMAVDFDEPVLENLKYTCQLIQRDEDDGYYNGDYYGLLWVFEGTELTCTAFLSTKTVAQLVSVFHKENIVNIAAFRDSWFSEPRRRAKHNSDT